MVSNNNEDYRHTRGQRTYSVSLGGRGIAHVWWMMLLPYWVFRYILSARLLGGSDVRFVLRDRGINSSLVNDATVLLFSGTVPVWSYWVDQTSSSRTRLKSRKKASAVRNGTEQTESGCPGLVVNENYNSYSMCESSIQKLSHSTWVGISCTVIRFSFCHL